MIWIQGIVADWSGTSGGLLQVIVSLSKCTINKMK